MRTSKNCVLCITAPIMLFAALVGNSSFFFRCRHQVGHDTIEFSFSKKRMLFPLGASCLVSLVVAHNVLLLGDIIRTSPDPLFIARIVIDTLLCLIASSVGIISTSKANLRIEGYRGLAYILQNSQRYGIDSMLSQSKFDRLRKKVIVCFSILVVLILGMVGYLVKEASNFSFEVLKRVAIFNSAFTFLTVTFLYDVEIDLYKAFMDACFDGIKNVLVRRRRYNDATGVNVVPLRNSNYLTNELQALQQLYSVISRNIRLFQRYINPGIVIVLTFVAVISVLVLYVIVKVISSREESLDVEYASLIFFVCFISIAVTQNLRVFQSLQIPGEDIQSFLFRYPISKLSRGEAAQVEMLINTLNIQKPVLKASDIFTVGTRLIASITGTVVTYVLVALQFKASWTKQ